MSDRHAQLEPVVEDKHAAGTGKTRRWKGWTTFVLIFGVILPVMTILFEGVTRLCSSILFDPFPTILHFALLALVPAANLLVILRHLKGDPRYSMPITVLVGASIGTAVVYSLQLLLVLPFSVMGILAFGIGLCGLAPYLALISTIICARRLKQLPLAEKHRHSRLLWAGVVMSSLFLGLYAASAHVTQIGLRMASSADVSTGLRGVRLIRMLGSRSALLRACYDLPTNAVANPFSARDWWNPSAREKARNVYYRVTGKPFNSVPPPKLVSFRSELATDFSFDSDVGGTAVNGKVSDLQLSSSRIDATVDPDALVAYTEWTLVFANDSPDQREARAEIALPPGGVVSRLTLWVNGEEREAAFGTRGQVRQAYEQVAVIQRRDPVLVTTCGPDRVLMQCFPVPAGGKMKVRVGITSSLDPEGYSKATFALPHFVERNFGIPDGAKHSLYIESPKEMIFAGEGATVGGRTISSLISDAELLGPKNAITCVRDPRIRHVWTPDRADPEHFAIVQELVESAPSAPKHIVIVMDGSQRMRALRGDVAKALESLPPTCRFATLLAAEGDVRAASLSPVNSETIREAQQSVTAARYVGGADNGAALVEAFDLAAENPGTAIVWIHGPQPITADAYTEQLRQRWERRPARIRVIAVPAAEGRNGILTDLEQTAAAEMLPRRASLAGDLTRLLEEWGGKSHPLITVRRRVPLSEVGDALKSSSHVCRLWARQQVLRMLRLGGGRTSAEASVFATRYQLVTPVSGAVVLETAEQYDQANLKPVNAKTAPSVVPEPTGLIALSAGMMGLLGAFYRGRKRRVGAS